VTPYYDDGQCVIYHGDALDVLPQLGRSFGGVVADPPYASGGRQPASTRSDYALTKYRSDWFGGDNMGTDSYTWWMRQVGRCLFDSADAGAHFYCFTDWRQYSNVIIGLETVRWGLRGCLVWTKNRAGAMGSFWRNDHELIPVFTKGNPTPLPDGSFFNVLAGSKPQGGEHPTEKPLAVVTRLIQATKGDVIDPFMGSGTTLAAAHLLGRRCVGVEIEERYCEIAANRLAQGVLPL
jgi:site-specific DNA-methyltransferase (adenine-specific)